MQQAYGLNDPLLPWTALAFGGGIARCQDVCGALTGSAIAIGLGRSRYQESREEARKKAYQAAQAFYRSFEKTFGHADCRCLTGYDFNTPEGFQAYRNDKAAQERCDSYVIFALNTLLDFEEKERAESIAQPRQ